MIVNMAISDLLFTIFLFPLSLVEMQADSWLVGDSLHQTLCKISFFLLIVSATVSIQSLILITVYRFGAVVVPIRSPLISKSYGPFFIIATWIVAIAANSAYLFSLKPVVNEHPGGKVMCTIQKSSANYYLLSNFIAFFTLPLFCWPYFMLSSWSSSSNTPIRVNSQPTQRNSGQEKTETCLRWPLLSFLRFFFAGFPSLLTEQYYILHRTVPFGTLAIFCYTISLLTSWPLQTAPSTRWSASFSAVIIAKVLRDFLVAVLQCKSSFRQPIPPDSKRFVRGDKKLRTIKLGPVFEGLRAQTWC